MPCSLSRYPAGSGEDKPSLNVNVCVYSVSGRWSSEETKNENIRKCHVVTQPCVSSLIFQYIVRKTGNVDALKRANLFNKELTQDLRDASGPSVDPSTVGPSLKLLNL